MSESLLSKVHINLIADQVGVAVKQVNNTIELLEDGATIPFISRYRKELTGALDEVQIAAIDKQKKKYEDLEKRKVSILKSIEEQGKLTDSLKEKIVNCYDLIQLEDLYLPYKRKRKTRASAAREKGLEPLAQLIFLQKNSNVYQEAGKFINDQVKDVEEALQGARDIIAEWITEDQRAREKVRQIFKREAIIKSKLVRGKEEEGAKYKDYFDFEEPLKKCPSHRLLAMRRGEEEGILRLSITPDPEEVLYRLEKQFLLGRNEATDQVKEALTDSYKRLLSPSIETEFRKSSKELADLEAIDVFAENLRQLLLAPPLGQKRLLGLDPGFRTGCKVVCLDANGDLLDKTTIFPHPPQSKTYESEHQLQLLIEKHRIDAIAVGNGTASRETMTFCRNLKLQKTIDIFLVNEAGASIYSASEIAREEFPDEDVTVRGAVSIGRRLMDPLAELVKIDPKSIGVGQYQHDVNQTTLKERLDQVVELCVNSVGVNINTASKHLLTYVSGLGPSLANNIVQFRQEIGAFSSREQLKKVPRMGDKAFEQSAGFLRIRDGIHPLDNTAVHPESYGIVAKMASDLGCSIENLIQDKSLRDQIDLKKYVSGSVGLPTLKDILKELEKPGLDPRGKAKSFEFANNIKSIGDLNIGMIVPGIINNITNFGAFVDIGIKESGLVHISNMANRFIKNPNDVVRLNQEVQVKVIDIDLQRKRIQLSMKDAE